MRVVSHSRVPRSGERGGAIVEAALVLPIIFLVIVGTVDASRFMISKTVLAYAVIAGARAATANANTQSNVQNAVIAAAPMLQLTSSNFPTSPSWITPSSANWGTRTHGTTVSVTATYSFVPSNPLFTKIGARTLSYTSTMNIP